MNNIIDKKSKCWNTRLKECLAANNYTQTSFADILNERYSKAFTQKIVSDWMSVGCVRGKREIGFPIYNNMIRIADCLGVSVGYLTGETDMDTFTLEKASNYLHLSGDAIKAINKVTDSNRSSLEFGYQPQKYRCILNKFLTSKGFHNLVYSMRDLDDCCSSYREVWEKLSEKLGDKLLKEAIDCYNGPIDYLNDPNAEELRPELYKAIGMVDTAIDKQHDLSYALKVAHYELRETFEGLIDEMYPEK
jgi:transcriptional regulator with XRE-family HTH domain